MSRVRKWVQEVLNASQEHEEEVVRFTTTVTRDDNRALEVLGKKFGESKTAFSGRLIHLAIQDLLDELGYLPQKVDFDNAKNGQDWEPSEEAKAFWLYVNAMDPEEA